MISTESAEHYLWGDGCDGWHLVRNSTLSVIQERVPPGAAEEPHLHERARQFFYVLRGTAIMRTPDGVVTLGPGDGIEIAPGTLHQLANQSDEDVEFLVVSQPHAHGDRVTQHDAWS